MTQEACEFTSVTFTSNPAKAGASVNLVVTLKNFNWTRWSSETWDSVNAHTWNELKGE